MNGFRNPPLWMCVPYDTHRRNILLYILYEVKKVKLLEERIKKDGKALGKTVLKVDSFINHQVDSEFMDALGKDFAEHFKDCGITKVFTIESSGIAPALMTAKYLDVPMIILKKQTSKILNGKVYQTRVTSFKREQAMS